ncbi:hypothetical protein PAXINDRAFT_14587 [Paxillus involutus ATCC 200175]|uniref:Unplaced genomic scaffold PAXINscaffold_39, whole genome shotgun sequence n=1 Tax=Paxillus involutus ATCC 200175 TaxID=664439 RepID=A0A0C9TQE5_PAXIN|nr:hypothetical protein PAXINDRAFT_14587 [Paxillus involutus ATCC 200175]
MPSVSRLPFEAHPFAIASFDSDLFNSVEEEKPCKDKSNQRSIANVRGGLTARLEEAALAGRKVIMLLECLLPSNLFHAWKITRRKPIRLLDLPLFRDLGLDRLLRVVRLIVFNHFYFGFRSGSTMDATAESRGLCFHRPPHFHWTPGQTAYLIMPSVSRLPFEAHPFAIASFDSDLFNSVEEEKPCKDKSNQRSIANVRGGLTARLEEAALAGRKVIMLLECLLPSNLFHAWKITRRKPVMIPTGIIEDGMGNGKEQRRAPRHGGRSDRKWQIQPLSNTQRRSFMCHCWLLSMDSTLRSARSSVPGVQSSDKRRAGRP